MRKIIAIITFFSLCGLLLNSCGIYRPVDAKKYPPQPEKRIKKNMEEGKGIRIFGGNDKKGSFEFANSNPLWRASLETIEFMPLLSVDYGGGLIITDWFSENNENESIKISIQFLSNEVRSDALKITVFKRVCNSEKNCKTSNFQSKINQELKLAILKKAAQFEKDDTKKNSRAYNTIPKD